jgi:hypothetical protein
VDWGSNLQEFREDRTVRYCLRPGRGDFLAGLRASTETTFGHSAKREGFPRWGTKELYWRVEDLQTAAEIWPEAKIVLLTRRFRDTFASAIGLPEFETVACKVEFIRSWLGIAREASYARRAGLPLITARYEDLIADNCRGLAQECGLPEPPPLDVFNSSRREITPADEDLLRPFADEIASLDASIGYSP